MENLVIDMAAGSMDCALTRCDGPAAALIVMFTDIGGIRDSFFQKAQAVSRMGYDVLLPNVYYRQAVAPIVPPGVSFRDPSVWPEILRLREELTGEQVDSDLRTLMPALERQGLSAGKPVAVVGYCMSAVFALQAAALFPAQVAAVAAFHGSGVDPDDAATGLRDLIPQIRARVYLGHADKDERMPPEMIGRLDRALAEAGVHFTTELFSGALHGFTATDAPVYSAKAYAQHLRRLDWLLHEVFTAEPAPQADHPGHGIVG